MPWRLLERVERRCVRSRNLLVDRDGGRSTELGGESVRERADNLNPDTTDPKDCSLAERSQDSDCLKRLARTSTFSSATRVTVLYAISSVLFTPRRRRRRGQSFCHDPRTHSGHGQVRPVMGSITLMGRPRA